MEKPRTVCSAIAIILPVTCSDPVGKKFFNKMHVIVTLISAEIDVLFIAFPILGLLQGFCCEI
jgi:hypothetical protein